MTAMTETRLPPKQPRKPMTAERFFTYRYQEGRELVAGGLLKLRDTGGLHGSVANEVAFLLTRFAREHELGQVVINDTGFILDPLTVRKPDVAFVPKALWKLPPEEGFLPSAPPLAIEVVSRTDVWSEVEDKARKYLEAGTREVWIVSPFSRTVQVWRAEEEPFILAGDSRLESPALLPGFSVPISAFFSQTCRAG